MQVVIIPIVKQEADKESVEGAAQGLASALQKAGIRSHVDATPGKSPGWKFNEYELKVHSQQFMDLAATVWGCCLPDHACVLEGVLSAALPARTRVAACLTAPVSQTSGCAPL